MSEIDKNKANDEQLLASFLAYKEIPFEDFKSTITTANAMDFYVKNTPLDQLKSMFSSAGIPAPFTVSQASNYLKSVYRKFESVSDESYTGDFRNQLELNNLKSIERDLMGYDGFEDDDGNENQDDDNQEGFFDDSYNKSDDLGRLLDKIAKTGNTDKLSENPQSMDELTGRKPIPKKEGEGSEGETPESEGSVGEANDSKEDGEDGGGSADSNKGDSADENGSEKESDDNSEQDNAESEKQEDNNADGKQADSDKNPEEKKQDKNKESNKEKEKKEREQQNNDLEHEIMLCSQEVTSLEEEKEILQLIKKPTPQEKQRVNEISVIQNDLKYQITNMMGAINADIVLGNDVQFPESELPIYINRGYKQFAEDLIKAVEQRLNASDYPYPYKIADKTRRNLLITQRVLPDVVYWGYEKLKSENLLHKLYLTKDDILSITIESGKRDVPRSISVNTVIEEDSLIITDATSIDAVVYHMNHIQKSIEVANKEMNLNLVFGTIRKELFDKFII